MVDVDTSDSRMELHLAANCSKLGKGLRLSFNIWSITLYLITADLFFGIDVYLRSQISSFSPKQLCFSRLIRKYNM